MNPVRLTSLNAEIQQMLAGLNLPREVRAVLVEGVEKLRTDGVGQGLIVGQKAPDFQLANQENRQVKLSEVSAKGPVVLKFIRGEWCAICNTEVAALKRVVPQLKELSATLLIINPQKPDKSVTLTGRTDPRGTRPDRLDRDGEAACEEEAREDGEPEPDEKQERRLLLDGTPPL